MYLKSFLTNVVLTVILFIMVHVNKSVARMERGRNTRKLLKYDDETISWLKQKRTYPYRDPCEKIENVVTTRSLETKSKTNDCPPKTCVYIPKKLKEIKCNTGNGTGVNAVRRKSSCNYIPGACMDIHATITVLRMFSNGQIVERNVSLNVGCACMHIVVN